MSMRGMCEKNAMDFKPGEQMIDVSFFSQSSFPNGGTRGCDILGFLIFTSFRNERNIH